MKCGEGGVTLAAQRQRDGTSSWDENPPLYPYHLCVSWALFIGVTKKGYPNLKKYTPERRC